jgi:dienelactone hydrolase
MHPLILLSPINGSNTVIVDSFAQLFVRFGYHAAIVHRRKFRHDREQDIHQVEHYLRNAVIRQREALDWLLKRPDVDARRVGTVGISHGAIVHASLAGIDPRARHHVPVMAVAPLPRVMEHSPNAAFAPTGIASELIAT